MVGGDADVVERCRPVFETYADPIVHLGELGSGQTTKLLNNLLFTANLGTAATTLSLGEALGVCPTASPKSSPAAAETASRSTLLAVTPAVWSALPAWRAALLQKDVRLVADLADLPRPLRRCRARRRRRHAGPDGTPAMTAL